MAKNFRTKTGRRFAFPVAWTVASAALVLPPHSGAAEWRILPGIDLKETYTDNLGLASAGAEKSDFVTEVSPRIAVSGEGQRLKLNAMYALRHFEYARDGGSTTLHQLSAAANAELLDKLFFVDGRASLSPQNISAFGPQVAERGNPTDNRAEVRTYSLSPYLRHRFGSTASTELRYTYDSVNTDAGGGLLDSQSDRISLRMDSGPAFRTINWSLQYDDQRIDYDNSAPVDMRTLSGSLRYLLSPRVSLNATTGYEKHSYVSMDEKPEGAFWSLGASWMPTERTDITASAGKRYFGNTFSLATSHRTRGTAWTLGYHEDITTARSQFQVPVTIDTSAFLNQLWSASIPDPAVRQQFVDAFIREMGLASTLSQPVNSFTNRVFLQKSIQASMAVTGARNTLVFGLFRTVREPQSPQETNAVVPGILEGETKQVGAQASWNWRITSRTHANVGAGYSRVTSRTTDRKDEQRTLSIGLTRQFQPKVSGGVELRRLEQKTNLGRADIRENAITAFLSMNF